MTQPTPPPELNIGQPATQFLLDYTKGLKRELEGLRAKPFHLTAREAWVAVFLALTGGAVGMELWAAVIHPGHNDPPWTSLIVQYIPPGVTFALIAILVSWIGPHFVQAYRKRGKG